MKTRLALPVALALMLTAAAAQAQTPPEPARMRERPPLPRLVSTLREPVEIPITLTGAQVVVESVRINGRGPFRFLLDTGAQGSGRADASLVAALGLPQVGVVGASDGGTAAARELGVHRIDSLELGPLRFEGLDVASRDYNAEAAAVRGPISGVLGVDLFHGVLATIDYGRGVLRLEPGALPEADGVAVLALDPARPTPSVTLTLAGQSVQANIDTGSMGGVTVGPAIAERLAFAAPPTATGQTARTVSGAFEVRQGRLDGDLVLGAIRIPNPDVAVMPQFRTGNLGSDFLRHYVVTLDMANHRVRFAPAARSGPPPPRRYGFMMPPPRGGETELVLGGTASGSPAEAAGLRAGDRIVALNGVAIPDVGSRLPALMRESPLEVTYIRDGQTLTATLRLE